MTALEICKQAWLEYCKAPSQDRLNYYHRYLVELTREELDRLSMWGRSIKSNKRSK